MIFIWAVNCCQSDVLVVRKFEFDCQGLIVSYDIEIFISIFFIYNKAIFTRKATPPPWLVEWSFLIVS